MLFIGLISGGVLVWVIVQKKWQEAQSLKQTTDQRIEVLRKDRISHDSQSADLQANLQKYIADREELDSRLISYKELAEESAIIKRDLQNVDVQLRKNQLDLQVQNEAQNQIAERSDALARRFLKDNLKSISNSLNPNNFVTSKDRLINVIRWCREIGFAISASEEEQMIEDLKTEFEQVVRYALEREEQSRIKAQLREDLKIQREIERERQQLERERIAVETALELALKESSDQHSAEIEMLRAKLIEAEDRSRRALSQAQLTRVGHVYVISNLGAFGPDIFKVGMTRRLEPLDRITELGDASVPFPFDVHMMISCSDAPSLENALHRELNKVRVNRINPRKEFFRTDIETIRKIVIQNHGQVDYVADAEALEYWQSKNVSEEDAQFIDHAYAAATPDRDGVIED